MAGTHSGVGKTTLAMGIMQAFARTRQVQPFKVGPDYIDPAFHTHITGRRCRNLDGWLLPEETLQHLFARSGSSADLCVIEGVMGMYDGAGTAKDQGSTAHLARVLEAPVVLVLDARAMAASAAAVVLGFRDYDPGVKLEGVILNNVSGERHYELLQEVIQRDTGVRSFGYLPFREGLTLPSRHLGLVPRTELADLENRLGLLEEQVRAYLDLEGLETLARHFAPYASPPPAREVEPLGRVRVAVALDRAFHFYYWDNLELLEELGAELIPFSPLEDRQLPENVDLLLLGGGFPEVFAAELEANAALRQSIREALEAGLPVYGECGGLMYLSRQIRDHQGEAYAMVGAFPGAVSMTERLQRFGYVEVENTTANLLGPRGTRFRAHEFHYSRLDGVPGHLYSMQVYKFRDGERARRWPCGIQAGSMLASYPHLHYYANLALPRFLLQAGLDYRKKRTGDPS